VEESFAKQTFMGHLGAAIVHTAPGKERHATLFSPRPLAVLKFAEHLCSLNGL
jgi:hypothetical protein